MTYGAALQNICADLPGLRKFLRVSLLALGLQSFWMPSHAETLGELARRGPSIERGAIARLVEQYDNDVALCRRGQTCKLPASFFVELKKLKALQPWEQLRQVNLWVNAFPYHVVVGPGNTVANFLAEGGSCKEYVLTKLVILRDLGFKLEHLWPALVVVSPGRYHEVLLVRIDGVLMVLSNSADPSAAPAMLAMSPYNDYQALWIVRLPQRSEQAAYDGTLERLCG